MVPGTRNHRGQNKTPLFLTSSKWSIKRPEIKFLFCIWLVIGLKSFRHQLLGTTRFRRFIYINSSTSVMKLICDHCRQCRKYWRAEVRQIKNSKLAIVNILVHLLPAITHRLPFFPVEGEGIALYILFCRPKCSCPGSFYSCLALYDLTCQMLMNPIFLLILFHSSFFPL